MITVVILTKNEEANIVDCIESVLWADEILVIDTGSDDRTLELVNHPARKNIHVLEHAFDNNFADIRNYALRKASGDWILFVDADERVSVSLQYEILGVINHTIEQYSGYYIRRRDMLWGHELLHGEAADIKLLRLAKKDTGVWQGKVHEVWKVKGKVGILQNHLTHHPHKNISDFLHKINFYTDLRAQELYDKKVSAYWWSIIVYPFGKFFINYLIKRGFLDGTIGLVHALSMSFHSFLVRGKLWQLWRMEETHHEKKKIVKKDEHMDIKKFSSEQ